MGEVRQPTYRDKNGQTRTSAVWWIRYYRDGKRYEENSHSKSYKEASDLLKHREGDGAKGIPVTPKIGRLTFDEAAADVVTDYRVNKKSSLEDVERRIRLHLQPYFGGYRMATITTKVVRAYTAARLQAGAANAQINRELAILKRSFSLAIQAGQLLFKPHIEMLDENNVRQGFFERAEFEDVRAGLPEYLRGAVTFAFLTGWRLQSEILPITWAQVDRRAGTVRLEPGTTKNDDGRLFPYGDVLPELRQVIEAQWRERERLTKAGEIVPLVFHHNGKQIRAYRTAWATACKNAGCSTKIPHDFRRTAVRNLVRAGVPEQIAMKLTGHKTRSVFDRYDIVNERDLQDAVTKLGAATGMVKGKSARSGRVTAFRRPQNRKIS